MPFLLHFFRFYYAFLLSFFFFFVFSIVVEVGGWGVRVGGEGRCSGRSGTGGDCSSYWLEPEGVVLLSPCDAYRMFHSECMLVARPSKCTKDSILKIQY